jgi:hypothetical protein
MAWLGHNWSLSGLASLLLGSEFLESIYCSISCSPVYGQILFWHTFFRFYVLALVLVLNGVLKYCASTVVGRGRIITWHLASLPAADSRARPSVLPVGDYNTGVVLPVHRILITHLASVVQLVQKVGTSVCRLHVPE